MITEGRLAVTCKGCGGEIDEVSASRLRDGSGWHCYSCRIYVTGEAEFAPLWEGSEPDPRAEVIHTGGWCLTLYCDGRALTVEDDYLVCDYGPTGWDDYAEEGTVLYCGPDAGAARAALLEGVNPGSEVCVRCGAEIALASPYPDASWQDRHGMTVCGDWTGHDSDGIYGPSHAPRAADAEREDLTALAVHMDGDRCEYCEGVSA